MSKEIYSLDEARGIINHAIFYGREKDNFNNVLKPLKEILDDPDSSYDAMIGQMFDLRKDVFRGLALTKLLKINDAIENSELLDTEIGDLLNTYIQGRIDQYTEIEDPKLKLIGGVWTIDLNDYSPNSF